MKIFKILFLPLIFISAAALFFLNSGKAAADICSGLKPGVVYFFSEEIDRDKPLPAPVDTLEFGKPMYALACLTQAAGPQEAKGKKFRVVLSVKQTKSDAGKYSSYVNPKQEGVMRPALSKARKDIIIFLHEDFNLDSLAYKLDAGEYTFRLQAASETATDKYDVTFDFSNDVAYIQQLRKAGYLADGKVKVVKKN